MIVLPSGARVWLACGYTDTFFPYRRGSSSRASAQKSVRRAAKRKTLYVMRTAMARMAAVEKWSTIKSLSRLPSR
jgi:hypothetical protein